MSAFLRRPAVSAVLATALAGLLAGCSGGAAPKAAPSPSARPPDYSLETAPPARGSTEHPNQYEFGPRIDNPWFPLWPGTRMEYVERTPAGPRTETVTVTRDTRAIRGVITTVVRTDTREHGQLLQSVDRYYAQDVDGNVWLFGRHAAGADAPTPSGAADPGSPTPTAGPSAAPTETSTGTDTGTNTAASPGAPTAEATEAHWMQPVIVMPAVPRRGSTYGPRQAAAAGAALAGVGRSVVVRVGGSVHTSYGRHDPVLEVERLDDPQDRSYYAKGVGLVMERSSDGSREELVRTTLFD